MRLARIIPFSSILFFLIPTFSEVGEFRGGWVYAYEETTVINGASVSGMVTFTGSAPPPRSFQVTMGAYPEHCKTIANKQGNILLPRARVSKSGQVADVVVFIQDLDRGKPASSDTPVLTVTRCRFDRLVMAGLDGELLRIRMMDTVLHPLRGWEMLDRGRIPLFQFPDLKEGEERTTQLKTRRSGVVKVECDQHRFMQVWMLVLVNPYFAVTDAQGRFTIDEIPPGAYTLAAWQPTLGYVETQMTVKPNQHHQTLVLTFEGSSS